MRPILSAARPSMVTTFLPATAEMGVVQARTASPPTSTVHAPQTAMPQPNFVPVSPNSSRTTHINGVSGCDADETALPFRMNFVAMRLSLKSVESTAYESAPRITAAPPEPDARARGAAPYEWKPGAYDARTTGAV